MNNFGYIFILSTIIFCSVAMAQQTPANNQNPIEITASKAVEWQQKDQKYVARENVVVTQGNLSITTDLLTADYRDGATSSTEIWQMTADGNVVIKDEKNTAYGDLGVYDVIAGIATLTGQNLKLVSPDQTITARDKMEYFSNDRKATAVGNAKVVRAKDTLTANSLTAYFKGENAAAKPQSTTPSSGFDGASNNLDKIEAVGRVVIKTPTETLYADKAVYKADTNIAEMMGNVRVERDKNVLEGDRAEVNLTTNVSKMFGSDKQGGRVRGVFFPAAKDAPAAPDVAKTDKPVAMPQTQTLAPVPEPVKVSPAIKY